MKHTIKTNEILTTTQQKNYKKLNAGAIVLLAAIAFSVIGLVLVVAVRTHVAYMLVDTIQRQATQSNWYNPAWQYRRQITISNINDPVQLQNYQVSLQLNAANFTFANAQPNGSDIRFTDSDGVTLLNYWKESYSSIARTANVYIRVPLVPALGTTTIYLYYGNPNATASDSPYGVFNFYNAFDASFGQPALQNAANYLALPTYDGSGQAVEPTVLSFGASGWHGYKYWMSTTPDPNGNENYENPSILASNDGLQWVIPAGVHNPLVATPVCDHNSDTALFYNAATNELWMYYNDTRRAARCSSYANQPWYNHNFVDLIKSSDGVHWSAPQVVLDQPIATDGLFVSPSISQINSTYYMWGVKQPGDIVFRYTSPDGTTWANQTQINMASNVTHMNIVYIPSKQQYWMVYDYPDPYGSLHFATSSDGLNWLTYPNPLLAPTAKGWDQNMYRTTFLYDNATDQFQMWYSAYINNGAFHIGYATAKFAAVLAQLSTNGWTLNGGSGTWSSESTTVKRGSRSAQLAQGAGASFFASYPIPLANGFYQEWDMYDSLANRSFQVVRNAGTTNKEVGLGIWTGASMTNYVYHDAAYHYTVTPIRRSTGWHKFGILIKGDGSAAFYVDNAYAGNLPAQFTTSTTIRVPGYQGMPTTYYVDDMRVRQAAAVEPLVTVLAEEHS